MNNGKDHDEILSKHDAAEFIEDVDSLRARLEEAEKRADENLQLLQRTQADFVNYRRRVEQEKGELANQGKAQVMLKILPVLDDFNLALANSGQKTADGNWARGIELIHRKLVSTLAAEGIARIEAEGQEFNPWEHEAVLHVPSEEHPAGIVIGVLRDGYKMGSRVIRPAQVKVSKGS